MKSALDIISWVSQISPSPELCRLAKTHTTKRRRSSESSTLSPIATVPIHPTALPSSTPISPPSSYWDEEMPRKAGAADATSPETPNPPLKRIKRAAESRGDGQNVANTTSSSVADDQDITPRQPYGPELSLSSYSDTTSQRSGSRSPTKKMRTLAILDDGIETRPLFRSDGRLPPELVEMLDDLMDIRAGIHVIAATRQAEIEEEAAREASMSTGTVAVGPAAGRPSFRPPRPMNYALDEATSKSRNALGPTPSVQQVLGIIERATICQMRGAEEAAWNSAVHYHVLHIALHGGDRPTPTLVDVTQCTSATIINEYLSTGASGKKVDFVLHIEPSRASDGDTCVAQIESLRAAQTLLSINHTDHDALLKMPLVVSIETKKFAAEKPLEAQVQMGTWQAAQWNQLATLATRGTGSPVGLQNLPYLPAIIVQGHDWAFAATTREGKKAILWMECPFGSTRDLLGVYSIICGIQTLAKFARDTYWPWYQRYVLGLPVTNPLSSK